MESCVSARPGSFPWRTKHETKMPRSCSGRRGPILAGLDPDRPIRAEFRIELGPEFAKLGQALMNLATAFRPTLASNSVNIGPKALGKFGRARAQGSPTSAGALPMLAKVGRHPGRGRASAGELRSCPTVAEELWNSCSGARPVDVIDAKESSGAVAVIRVQEHEAATR